MLGQENYFDSSTKKIEEEKIGQRRFKNNLKLVALNETVAKSHRQQHVCYNDYNGLKYFQQISQLQVHPLLLIQPTLQECFP